MPSPRQGSRVGSMFGPYELQALLGAGGMGEVYRAYDTAKGRTVALKLLLDDLAADEDYRRRFQRESRVAARLAEPHVIPVHDWGEIDGVLYIDMRLVEGRNLKTVLTEDGPLSPEAAGSVISQLASALDAAHRDGLVHRDVKPENVLITPDGFVYLVDFGIAYSGVDPGLTTAGHLVGSKSYMAPERFTSEPLGPAADIYSLACLLYQCLTGTPPFHGADISQLIAAHLFSAPPRPSQVRPGLSPAFDAVVAKGMAKRADERFASAGELARAALDAAAPQLTPHLRQQPAKRSGRVVVGAIAAAVVVAAAVAAVVVLVRPEHRSSPAAPPSSSRTEPARATPKPTTASALAPTTSGISLPDADAHGFLGYPDARCHGADVAALAARTTKSALVVCKSAGTGTYYYRGLRLSDGAAIELPGATPAGDGFDAVNPDDGTRYEMRREGLTIRVNGQVADTEPMVEYAGG
ncbi:serine/threonine-protein kinase [Mycobacterium branderi]|uniref:non-specific serine/threonine protein kinase n=2 Tax=Mycobacterium branderi TaxID=43348 RepID=A0AA91RGI7_9MYCO|nr:serine/threonine-protein kinase [Mycobacterium branderi]MCV7232189.1 serine/threonine protein kinase [Mycobacterium branderi]ORA33804.1 serine/threonine protein kinase [Mycobacterium branderi]